jgi:hypothetical protein
MDCENVVKSGIRRIVLDVLKPHQPSLPEFADYVGELKELTRVDVTLVEMDERTDSLKVIVEGNGIDFETLREHISKMGAVIHSVDQVVVETFGNH